MSDVGGFKIETFSARSSVDAASVTITCEGDADSAAIGHIEQLLEKVHAHAVASTTPEVIVDLRAVKFMNSSCFTKLIGWVTRVRGLDGASRYRIHLLSNQEILWQRKSLQALKCFAVDLITIGS